MRLTTHPRRPESHAFSYPHVSPPWVIAGVAAGLLLTVNASAPVLAGTPFPAATLSISVGVAHRSWVAGEAMNRETEDTAGEALFRAADSALYGAKSRGRNQVFVAPDSAPPSVTAAGATPGASPRAFSG